MIKNTYRKKSVFYLQKFLMSFKSMKELKSKQNFNKKNKKRKRRDYQQ